MVAVADLVAAADLVEAAASTEAVAGVVAMDAATAVVMASTVAPWLSAPVAGGTPTAFASAGTTDTGLIGVFTRDRQQEVGVSGNRHTFLFGVNASPSRAARLRVVSWRVLTRKSWQQLERIAALDRCELLIGEYRCLAQPFHVIDAGTVREVGTEHDL